MAPRTSDAFGRDDAGSNDLRASIREAMLRACGEVGYDRVTVERVVELADTTAGEFAETFSGLRECFEEAYAAEAGRLSESMLEAGRAGSSWRDGLGAALRVLTTYAGECTLILRALLLEVHVAGGAALACKTEIVERLSRALDSARRETESRHSPPPLTALFMVSVVEAATCSALTRGEPEKLIEVMPELEHLIVSAYFAE